ncbi:amidohydrolase family protein [Ruegeria aquimaris]|nr:amidohydrolase family protein [Ruegeria sp. XHP0148]
MGFGYDNAQLAELRHPTRTDLDTVSQDVPIVIVHQSGRLGVVNSKVLEVLGISPDTPDRAGGVIQRDATGAPNWVLEKHAFFSALAPMLAGVGSDGMVTFAEADKPEQEGRLAGAGEPAP